MDSHSTLQEVRQYIATSKILYLLTPPKLYILVHLLIILTIWTMTSDVWVYWCQWQWSHSHRGTIPKFLEGFLQKKELYFFLCECMWMLLSITTIHTCHFAPKWGKMCMIISIFSLKVDVFITIFSHSATLVKKFFLRSILSPISVQLNF